MNLKIRRFIALYIDIIITGYLIVFPIKIACKLVNDNMFLEGLIGICGVILFYYLLFLKDLTFKNASIGKKLMRLAIYEDNKIPSKSTLIIRNKISFSQLIFNVYQVLVYGYSKGDVVCKTEVKFCKNEKTS